MTIKKGILLDLDQTLVNSRSAENYRKNREWGKVDQLIPDFDLYPGILELIEDIYYAGWKIGIVTSAPREYALKVTEHFKISCDTLVGFYDTASHKPDPEPYRRALEDMEVKRAFAYAVGDGQEDIDAANELGIISIGATWGKLDGDVPLENFDLRFDEPIKLADFLLQRGPETTSQLKIERSPNNSGRMDSLESKFKEIHKKLELHFEDCSKKKNEVFALEHPLDPNELEILDELEPSTKSFDEFWLLWVVRTAEAGYTFTQDGKFWEKISIEMTTKSRNAVRDCFIKFSETYKGIKPEGRWAEEFTIISWPITHSIFPSYLQTQLADEILEISSSQDLYEAHFSSPKALGEFIVDNYSESGSQFDTMMKHPEILGALALEFEGTKVESPIFKDTFKRIIGSFRKEVKNLDHIRQQTKSNFTNARRRTRPFALGSRTPRGKNSVEGVLLVPFVCFDDEKQEWVIKIKMPRIRNKQFSKIRRDLLENSLRLNFANVTTLYPGDLAYRLPDKDFDIQNSDLNHPLLQYLPEPDDTPDDILERYSIKSVFGEFPWIFKLTKDETRANKISGKWLRNSSEYIYITDVPIQENALFNKVSLRSKALKAYFIQIPEKIDHLQVEILKQHNLGINDGIDIYPLGNSLLDFHEENIHLQEGDPLIFRLFSNQILSNINLTLFDELGEKLNSITLDDLDQNQDCIIDIGQKLPGIYHLGLTYSDEFEEDNSIEFDLIITPRENWLVGHDNYSLFAELKKSSSNLPFIPSLDEILDSQIEFFIHKPSSSIVNIEVELYEHDHCIDRLEIPMTKDRYETNDWEETILVRINEFDLSKVTNLKVIINGYEHGYYVFDCKKEGATSVYWSYIEGEKRLTLHDDNRELNQPKVKYYSVQDPLKKEGISEYSTLMKLKRDQENDSYYIDNPKSGLYTYNRNSLLRYPSSASMLFIDEYDAGFENTTQTLAKDTIYENLRFWLNPDRVVCINKDFKQDQVHRNILQRLSSRVLNLMRIKDELWVNREIKYLDPDIKKRQENILWSRIEDLLNLTYLVGNHRIQKLRAALNQGPIKKAQEGGGAHEIHLFPKKLPEATPEDLRKIREFIKSTNLGIDIDIENNIFPDEGRIIVQGETGFTRDEVDLVSVRLRANLSDFEIIDHQELWTFEEILENCIAEIEDKTHIRINNLEKEKIKNFYNFSIDPFDRDIFDLIADQYSAANRDTHSTGFNYRASGLNKDPFEKMRNTRVKKEMAEKRKFDIVYIIIRYVLFIASEAQVAQKKDIFPGLRVI